MDRKLFPTPRIAKHLDTLEKALIVLIGWGLGIAGALGGDRRTLRRQDRRPPERRRRRRERGDGVSWVRVGQRGNSHSGFGPTDGILHMGRLALPELRWVGWLKSPFKVYNRRNPG